MACDDFVTQSLKGQELGQEYGNEPSYEIAWAIKAHERAQVHMNLLRAVDPFILRLCANDDVIYTNFRKDFPDLSLRILDSDSLKSPDNKLKWRSFCEGLKDHCDEFNFGTLLRLNAAGCYDESNVILVAKIQFMAIEIARNREGINSECKSAYSRIN